MTVTGQMYSGLPTTIEHRQQELIAFCQEIFPDVPSERPGGSQYRGTATQISDDEIIEKARAAKNGDKFARLWLGDTSAYGDDDSRADAAMAGTLAFWTDDDDQIARLMRRSGLNRPKFEREDYLPRTIEAARRGQRESYSGAGAPIANRSDGAASALRSDAARRSAATKRRPWPRLRPEAMRGLAGDVVGAIIPHTESDPVGILATFLMMFGSAAGRSPHLWIGEDRHGTNEYCVLVGKTSKGRKGSSQNGVIRILAAADADWTNFRRVSGLASGEGFVWQIRDPIRKTNKKGEEELVDEGVKDKRLFVLEEELSNVLKQTERDSNTLSEMARRAWDSREKLQKLTISNPVTATNPHVSIVGHITEDELRKRLNETEMANGLGNRFIWLCVKRSNLIALPSRIPEALVGELGVRVHRALDHARRNAEFAFTDEARAMWVEIYPHISRDLPGLLGALTGRAEAHTLRLALIYAALDCADAIGEPHLQAALALMDYAADSVLYLFGDATGNDVADRILSELREAGDLTRTEISKLFSGNVKAQRITTALEQLEALKLAAPRTNSETGGRAATIWTADLDSAKSFTSFSGQSGNEAGYADSDYVSEDEKDERNEKTTEQEHEWGGQAA
jgi:hypothetical protein